MRALSALVLASCASMNTSGPARPPAWDDFEESIEAIRCAVEGIDGADDAIALFAGVTFEVRDPYPLAGHYQPLNNGGARITLWGGADSAWHSALRYELLCRRRAHLRDRDPRRCTAARWEEEIKPRYEFSLRQCFFGGRL